MKEYKYTINGTLYTVAVGDIDNNIAQVEVNGTPYKVELQRSQAAATVVKSPKPEAAPRTASGEKVVVKPAAPAGSGIGVKAPLPGVILSINCKVGDSVSANDTVVVLEAMKMENAIKAGRDGKVTAINVSNGQSVLEGETLISIG